jgi:hypothetical protein
VALVRLIALPRTLAYPATSRRTSSSLALA